MAGGGEGTRRGVAVVGGGAAGAACAWSLARGASGRRVALFEREGALGGVATTASAAATGTGARFNDGVQGGAPSYRNTLRLLSELGLASGVSWVDMTVSFGTGERNWSNVGPASELAQRCASDVARFGALLRRVARFEWYYAFVPVASLLRRNGFSAEFADAMVYPLTALFFGTGSQTSRVSSVLVARVFNDPALRLFEYDSARLLSTAPRMFAFPPLADVYARLGDEVERHGGEVRTDCEVVAVARHRHGVDVTYVEEGARVTRRFDDVVFACSPEVSTRLLTAGGSRLGFLEKRALRSVEYFDDVTVSHTDEEYMARHYELRPAGDGDAPPMYFIKTYEEDRTKGEMSFDLTRYQPSARGGGEQASGEVDERGEGVRARPQAPIYQSIFLNRAEDEALWTRDEIDPSKVLLVKWWRQFAHSVRHLTRSVPLWRFVQGRRRTLYAGSYTLVNTHEIAVVSGLAAAARLGAEYPFGDDDLAAMQYDQYCSIIHGGKGRIRGKGRASDVKEKAAPSAGTAAAAAASA